MNSHYDGPVYYGYYHSRGVSKTKVTQLTQCNWQIIQQGILSDIIDSIMSRSAFRIGDCRHIQLHKNRVFRGLTELFVEINRSITGPVMKITPTFKDIRL